MTNSSGIILLVGFLLACGFFIENSEAVNVYCYYASWAADRPDHAKVAGDDLDPNLCTHVFYAFLSLKQEDGGKLSFLNETIDVKLGNIEKISNLKKINPNLKLLFSVGGASAAPYVFAAVAADDGKLANFVQSCEKFLDKYNFDGIDIDWEYPYDKPLLLKMAQALRNVFEPKGRLVTTAVAYNPEDAGYDVAGMNKVFDLINVMSYDFHGANAGKLGQNAPLFGSRSESSWQQGVLNCNASLWNWRNKGATPEKLALGAGFYGHTFKMADVSKNLPGDAASGPWKKGPYTDNDGTLGYLELCELHKSGTLTWDDDQKVPYLVDGEMWAGFDNERSLKEKEVIEGYNIVTERSSVGICFLESTSVSLYRKLYSYPIREVRYIKQEGISGIMIWSIETDDTKGICGGEKWPLLRAINEEIKNLQ